MKTIKHEEIYMRNYETYLDMIENLPAFIEEIYNKRRLHSSLGYLPPEEFEDTKLKSKDRPVFKL